MDIKDCIEAFDKNIYMNRGTKFDIKIKQVYQLLMESYLDFLHEYEGDFLKNASGDNLPLSLRSLVVTWLNFINILVEESPFISRQVSEVSTDLGQPKSQSSRLDSVLHSLFGSTTNTRTHSPRDG